MADNEDALPGEQIEDTGGEENAADKDESLSQNDLDNEGNAIPDNQAQEGATTENHVLEDATVENQLQEGGFLVTDDVTSGNQVQEVPENQFQETATSENQVLDDVTLETRIQEYATPENQVQEILQVQEVQEVETLVNQGPAREIAFSTRQDYVSGSEESETESESEIIKKWPRPRVLKTLQHARSRKFTLHQPEGYKERQVRMKELRQLRIASIKAQQKIILERVAAIFNIEFNEVLDGVVDSDDHMWLLDSFIAEGGTSNIIVCYASLPAPSIETGRFIPNLPNTYRRDRVFLAETRSSATFGDCVAIYRTERKSIEIRNVEDDVFYARFKSETNVVCSMFKLMERICVPALNATKEWGGVGSGKVNDPAIELHFRSQLKMFLKFMAATSLDIESCPQFTVDMSIYDDFIHSDEHSFEKVAKDIPVLTIISNYVKIWSKQISMVLVQSKQIRKEATDAGPLAELEHWRRQLVIFTSIVEHLKSSPCVMYISTLTKANSKLIKKWNVLVKSVTDSCNEAADNVKYLYSLEKYYEPLYSYDPIDMIPHLPGLMYTIRMIFSTSCYYNTKERIASLIVKVTNQIINSCIIFLSDNGKRTIWKQDKKKVIAKAKLCIQLYENYRKVYNETQTEMIEAKSETPFKCSETIIFGKFENLKKRLLKVIELFDIYIKYYVLNKTTIEGIEEFAMAFNKLYKTIATKEYDALDYRAPDFDNDYDTFKAGVAVQEFALNEFMNNHLRQCPTTEISQSLLERFCRLRLDCLRIEDQYFELIKMFTAEMEALRDKYNMDRDDPSLPWNMTPIAGRIYWIRCFYERIHQPMLKFQEQNNVIRNPSSQKCIKLYNSLLLVFIEYEQRYHSAWKDHMGQVKICFTSPLLLRQPSTRMIVVNFNPYILECMREIKYMRHLGLDMPNYAEVISSNENNILRNYELLKSLIDRNYSIRRRMPKLYLPLLKAQLVKIDKALQRGLSVLNWESLGITEYCDNLTRVLNEVDFFLREAMDMQEARIDTIFKKVSSILFVYLPEDAVTPDEFLAKNLKRMDNLIPELQQLADIAENAVEELILKCLEIIPSEEIQNMKNNWYEQEQAMKQVTSLTDVITDDAALYEIEDPNHYDVEIIRNDCNQLFAYFNTRMVESLVKATKDSLETLKQRAVIGIGGPATNKTLLKTAMKFNIPNSTVDPSIELIQTVFSQVITTVILNISRSLFMWGQAEEIKKYREKQAAATVAVATASKSRISVFGQTLSKMALSGSVVNINIRSYYRLVSEHKEVVRCMMSLQGAMIYYMGDVDSLIKKYLHYSYLWAEDRDDILREFVNSQPLLITIQEKFKQFEKQTDEVLAIPNHHIIGPLTIEMHDMKLALHAASTIWKLQLGKLLNVAYRARMLKVVEFINDHMKILKRKLKDLDDVRLAMNCLESIREHFFEMDMEIDVIVETYDMFTFFNVHVTKEDKDTVDSLRFKFQDLLKTGYSTQETINELQEPLQQELMEGVASLIVDIEKFESDYESKGPMAPGLVAREASDRAMIFQHRFEDLWRRFEMYSSGEKFFGMKVNEYPQLHQRKKEFTLLGKLYGLYLNVLNTIDAMFEIKWKDIDIDAIIAQLADFDIKCKKLPKGMKDWPAYIELKKKIDDIYDSCPLLEMMANKAMKERHWHKLEALMDCEFDIQAENFILKKVIEAPLLKHRYDVEDICVTALKEKDIEAKLKQVISDWAVINLSFQNFKARGELLIKAGETTEIITLLEDSLMILNSLASNRYNVAYKKEILLWISTLVNTSEILEKWLQVQNLWMYLEAVFVGGDIAKQLPGEAKKFAGIDKKYVKIMYRARDIPNAVDCCTSDATMKEMLPLLFEQLEACQKSLTGYLETKRLIFPRFFFVSDPVLLEILGQSSDPRTIQPHLLSLFDAVAMVDFDDRDRIIALNSDNGEKIELDRIVDCIGGVEVWLNVFLASMIDTVKTVIAQLAQMMKEPNFNFMESFIPFNAQAALLGVQLLWTKDAEYALKKSKIDKNIMRWTNKAFLDLLNSFIELTVKDLTKLERIRFETMVTIHVHQRDIFDALVRMRVKTLSDFEWQKQARFYYHEETDMCTVGITNVNFIYQVLPHREHSPVMQRYRFKHYISEEGDPKITNEYLGVTERLAITPLTDRCYITLAQAIGLNMGGAPAGPAGTGKTETTKDMGRCLGKLVVVFNCSDQMDFRGLGRIYKGLAQSGSWGCFDEFNRIELPVLSVAAQLIYICLTARKEKKTSFIFSDGDTVPLNPEFGFFITMNPGYAGRQELPENLKIQFRSVAMMVPDKQIIMRVKLASCGFKDNIVLARKFFTLYKLCEEQLSKQVHYDFGLRNILSVLRTLGAQKRANPESTEETIVMRVLKDMNVSKLVDEDEPLFLSLIDDLFPGLKLGTSSYKDLQKAIAATCTKFGLVNHPDWNLKIIQLYETSLVRHGLMVLGPTGAGKTKCIQTLLDAFTELGKPHKEMRMNPKAITASQMFGRLDFDTNDWTDGIFSTLWRRSHKIKKNEFSWIVLDGPVDAVWIENLNSVLDDNKTLTLANGDRIVMAANCKLVIEPDNVDNASPATISRVGMTFISSSVMGWQTILQGWLNTRNSQEVTVLGDSFNKSFFETITFIVQKLFPKMNILEALYVRQACDILSGLLESGTFTDKHLERLYLFSLMWSLGAVLELDDRKKMMEFCTMLPAKLSWPKIQAEESIFDYFVNEEGVWQHWSERLEEFIYPDDSIPEYASILVPNVDNVRTAFLIDNIAKQNKCVLLIGEQGTAKTVMLKSYMAKYDPEVKLYKCINFSSATSPNLFQRIIESYVEKKVGTTFGPPGGRMMTVFIDDINMPIINEWGDQITNEIVRQLMECTGFFSLDKPGDFNTIVDIQIFGAMIHPGGGRNDIPPRLKRQFNIFNCTLPSVTSMDKIFGVIAGGYFCLSRFPEFIVKFMPKLVELTRATWQNTKVKMLPTPAKFHYVFNLRDLSRIWEGILKICAPELPNIGVAMKLWYHECMRVIADRFTNTDDRDWFVDNLRKTAESMLSTEEWEQFPEEETFFVNFMREAPEYTGEEPEEEISTDPPKVYEEVPSFDAVQSKLEEFMANFNESIRGQHLNLVLFRDAMIHLLVISRIINTHRGNALLVGVGGSGKQSLTKLASFIAGYVFYQISLSRSYNLNNFMEDIKHLYRVAGLKGSGISFIFTDNDINDEAFLEYLNNILSSGEIANLFPKDEMDEILSELTPIMRKFDPKRPPTPDVLYEYFIIRSRANLHIALCFSPVGEKFRNRALKFPGLISGCTMDWFHKWPKEALIAVANHFLSTFPMVCTPEVKVQMIKTMSEVQDGVSEACVQYFERFRRQTYVTPKSYLSFLDGYKTIYTQKFENINMLAMRMSVGLTKLKEASTSVDALKRELEPKKVEILAATVKAEAVLAGVAQSAAAAEVVKREVLKVKERAVRLVEEISADQAVAAKKLEAAEPALRAAEAALETIRPADIATVKKLGKPPFLITLIMDCVGILFRRKLEHVKPDPERRFLTSSWSESLKIMGDVKFMSNLMNFPKDGINGETCDLLYPYFNYESYTFEAAKSACGNVAGLISWTLAMEQFYLVNKDVLPLKANLAVQQSKYNAAKVELNAAEATLAAKEAELAEVQKEFDNAMRLKSIVLEDARACQEKMDATMMLIDGLSGERVRWTEQSALFQSEIERLIGDVLLLTGFLSYAGPFNQEFRNMLNNSWIKQLIDRKIPVSTNLNISDQLADSLAIAEWNLNGLPNDELSIQNGIIATKSSRFPLLIDPQIQGKTWIENTERENGLIVTSLTAKYFRNNIEDAVSLGIPILIVDIGEELDPSLDNVLERNFIKVGNSYKVKVGDKEIDVSDNFRLYFTTQLSNPAYTPEIYARCSIIDFTVTVLGLEDQLLGRVIRTEKAELEVERTQLITSITANKRKMQELESNLLHKLTTIQGSLVEDVSLIQTLNVTKATATDVKEKLDVARETEIKINLAREEFRPVATRGCILYFLVCNMSMVCCMYQTSLAQFLERFDISMERSQKNAITLRRLNFIIEYLTFDVFKYISRGFYESHKYMFVLLMTLQIDLKKEYISYDECQVFIKGGAALNLKACPVKPHKWISDLTWLNLVQLSFLRLYQNLLMQITNNEKLWKSWFDKEAPEEEIIPDGYNGLDVFRKLLVIRAWCPDRTLAQSRKYVISSLGQRFIEPVLVDYKAMVGESRALVPLIGFLAMGSDPTPSIETTAKRLGFKCSSISMGQGQEIHARKLIQHAVAEGEWVLLQNCHLSLDYMSELLILFVELEKKPNSVHTDFRVWITTEVAAKFPISLLQISIKFTSEPPAGMRAGLIRTYSSMNQDLLDHSDSPFYLPTIFGLSFLHTVVQERRKFGPLGWNIPYEFNSADWLASCMFVQNHLDELDPGKSMSWTTTRYMIAEVHYGGRVTDDYDKRLLNAFSKVWFSDNLFSDEFNFYKGYEVMKFKTTSEYLQEIEEMKTTDPPQVYGLNSNANITYQSNTTRDMLETILSIQPKEASIAGGETREANVARQTQEMLDKLPLDFKPHEVKEKLQLMGLFNSMTIFLRQEIDWMQKVITLVRGTLRDLLLAIEGTIIMNESLRDALDNIFDGRVPRLWLRGSWESSSIGFWITELLERHAQFAAWCFAGRPIAFRMAGFFNPQGFLTAMRQEVTRAHKGWALDKVALHNDVTKFALEDLKKPPQEGVFVHGLFLDGAGWDRRNNRLCESAMKVLYANMPIIHIFAINSTSPKDPKLYQCPVYKKAKRTDLTFITPLWLMTIKAPEHWVLRGVAILCDIK